MPQLLVLILAGAALWVGYEWVRKETRRVRSDLREAEEALRRKQEREVPSLERDPETGVYRPRTDRRSSG